MTQEEVKVIADMQVGVLIVITHIFNCLHHRGVLPLSDAIASLEETEQKLPSNVSETARTMVLNTISGLRNIVPLPPPIEQRH